MVTGFWFHGWNQVAWKGLVSFFQKAARNLGMHTYIPAYWPTCSPYFQCVFNRVTEQTFIMWTWKKIKQSFHNLANNSSVNEAENCLYLWRLVMTSWGQDGSVCMNLKSLPRRAFYWLHWNSLVLGICFKMEVYQHMKRSSLWPLFLGFGSVQKQNNTNTCCLLEVQTKWLSWHQLTKPVSIFKLFCLNN